MNCEEPASACVGSKTRKIDNDHFAQRSCAPDAGIRCAVHRYRWVGRHPVRDGPLHTNDVDLVYARHEENIRRLATALRAWNPYLRGAPAGLPSRWNEATIRSGLNSTLTTTHGDLDLLGEVSGGGSYEQLLPFTDEVSADGMNYRVVTLEKLIHLKRAAGRPKDLEVIAELQALLEERRKLEGS